MKNLDLPPASLRFFYNGPHVKTDNEDLMVNNRSLYHVHHSLVTTGPIPWGHYTVVMPNAISINPLNWKLDDTYAPASENLGSLMLNEKTGEHEITDVGADAQVVLDRGVIVTNAKAAHVDMTEHFGPQSFHDDDYTFYYNNIKDNVAKRIATYLASR